jgi:serine phosphatase RsbU (regulator of sigma subunit)
LPDGRVMLALGDVAGKGSPAALLMALLLAMMRTLVDEGLEGAALAARLNAQIVKHAPRSRFITLFVGTLDPSTGELVYVNAGQNPPLLRRTNGSYEHLRAGGIALGMFDHSTYTAGRTLLDTGDVLVLYSDGVTEAHNVAGEEFGEERMVSVLKQHHHEAASVVLDKLIDEVKRFAKGAEQYDDVTALVVRYTGPPKP